MSEIDKKYQQLGAGGGSLGAPTTAELVCPDGTGHYRHYEHGSIYWHPLTGAHEVHGLIRKKWSMLGWEKGPLGYPKSDESETTGGRYNQFQRGVILWKKGTPQAFEVHGAIQGRYIGLNSENGFLGYPITDETATPDGVGRFSHFEHGSIYWKPTIGAHEVHGAIRTFWSAGGWEKNPSLGYPISNELPTKTGDKDRFNDFENGVVYWSAAANHANLLAPNPLVSRPAAEVIGQLGKTITGLLTAADPRIYITSAPQPFLLPVTDYEQTSKEVRNRRYTLITAFAISSGFSDPHCGLTFEIELRYNRSNAAVEAILRRWWYNVEVDFPASICVSADEVSDLLKAQIDPYVNKPMHIADIPSILNVLSLKVMQNGDLNCYTEPA